MFGANAPEFALAKLTQHQARTQPSLSRAQANSADFDPGSYPCRHLRISAVRLNKRQQAVPTGETMRWPQSATIAKRWWLCALALMFSTSLALAQIAAAELVVDCRARDVATLGDPTIWESTVEGGSGQYAYSWQQLVYDPAAQQNVYVPLPCDEDGTSACDDPVVAKRYPLQGRYTVRVIVTDQMTGQTRANPEDECQMYVLPNPDVAPYDQPATVTPVVWVPNDFPYDLGWVESQTNRVWRGLRMEFLHHLGAAFRLNPVRIVRSAFTEDQICLGPSRDCADDHDVGMLRLQVEQDVDEVVEPARDWLHERLVMFWGGGGTADNGRWHYPGGSVGDAGFAYSLGFPVATIEPDLAEQLNQGYQRNWKFTLGHELAHGIAWDIPHNFSLFDQQSEYVRRISLQSPWLNRRGRARVRDTARPSAAILLPAEGAVLSGTVSVEVTATDPDTLRNPFDGRIDAVVFLVDGRFFGIDQTPPYEFSFDTTQVGFGRHIIAALAYDAEGNVNDFVTGDIIPDQGLTTAERVVLVQNELTDTACSETFPSGVFEACFYEGIGVSENAYRGTLMDRLNPLLDGNSGFGINHVWMANETIAFGLSQNLTGVWRSTLDLIPGDYLFEIRTSAPVRVFVEDTLEFDTAGGPADQPQFFTKNIDGPKRLQLEWYQSNGPRGHLQLLWSRSTLAAGLPPSVPIGLPTGPVTILPGETLTWIISSTDLEGQPVGFGIYDSLRGPADVLGAKLIDHGDGSATFSWTPTLAQMDKDYAITFVARDPNGLASSATAFIHVAEDPHPVCVLPEGGERRLLEGDLVRLLVSCADPHGLPLTVAASGLPNGALFLPEGDTNLDSVLSAADLTRMLVLQGSEVIEAGLAIADLNGDGLIESTDLLLLEGLLFSPPGYALSWEPSFSQAGTYTVTLQATNSASFSASYEIVLEVVDYPEVQAIETPKQFIPNELGRIYVSAHDDLAASHPLSYRLRKLSGAPSGSVFSPLGDADLDGEVTVSDLSKLVLYRSGEIMPTPLQFATSDLDRDGRLTQEDSDLLELVLADARPIEHVFAWVPQPQQAGVYDLLSIVTNTQQASAVQSIKILVPSTPLATLRGQVQQSDGVGLPAVLVKLSGTSVSGEKLQLAVLTDAYGTYSFPALPSGTYRIVPRLRLYAFAPLKLAGLVWDAASPFSPTVFVGTSSSGTAPSNSNGQISGIVTSAFGEPLADVVITLKARVIANWGALRLKLLTGIDGRYSFNNLPAGNYTIFVKRRRTRFQRQRETVQLGDSAQRTVSFTAKP